MVLLIRSIFVLYLLVLTDSVLVMLRCTDIRTWSTSILRTVSLLYYGSTVKWFLFKNLSILFLRNKKSGLYSCLCS